MEAARSASRTFWNPAAQIHPDLVIISAWTVRSSLSYQITFTLTSHQYLAVRPRLTIVM